MRTCVFGSKGQLGRELVALFGQDGDARGWDLPELDIADRAAAASAVRDFGPDVVINAAAYTDVEGAEDHPDAAYRINETGARNVAQAAAEAGAAVVHYSTDYVFDGTKDEPYTPEDAPAPLSVYGQSKWAGEQAVREANARHFIIRTAWLFGPGGNNFVEKMLAAAAKRPKLKIVENEIGSPTYTLDLAKATRALCGTEDFGTYHAVNAGNCSRFEFTRRIFEAAGVATPIEPCDASEFPTKARRPLYSVLSNAKMAGVTGHRMPSWQDALDDYMSRR